MTHTPQSSPNGETRASLALRDDRPDFPLFVVACMREADYRTFQRSRMAAWCGYWLAIHKPETRQQAWDILYPLAIVATHRQALYGAERQLLASTARELMMEREEQS